MKIIKIIAIITLIVFTGIQFVPTVRNRSEVLPLTDFMLVNNIPNGIKNKLQISCYDCHSNNTQYPWYNKIQPFAWFLENHINEGKSELNFNEWNSLSNRRKVSKLQSIIKQIENNKMPKSSYTLIHNNAVLSIDEKQNIINYMTHLKDSLLN